MQRLKLLITPPVILSLLASSVCCYHVQPVKELNGIKGEIVVHTREGSVYRLSDWEETSEGITGKGTEEYHVVTSDEPIVHTFEGHIRKENIVSIGIEEFDTKTTVKTVFIGATIGVVAVCVGYTLVFALFAKPLTWR